MFAWKKKKKKKDKVAYSKTVIYRHVDYLIVKFCNILKNIHSFREEGDQDFFLSSFSTKTHVMGIHTHLKCLAEALLMSTHNICFHGQIR